MKVVICNAISLDGFIADLEGNSDWTKDDELFEQLTRDFGCIVLGSATFEQFEYDLYPIARVQHLVLSSRQPSSQYDNVRYVASVDQALAAAKQLGFDRLLVVGGSRTNASFARAGVIQELKINLHELILGKGLKLFGDYEQRLEFRLTASKLYPSFMHLEYEVRNK